MQDLKTFFEYLSEDARGLVPVTFRLLSAAEKSPAVVERFAASPRYRSTGYNCGGFYKPVSRFFSLASLGSEEDSSASESVPPTRDWRKTSRTKVHLTKGERPLEDEIFVLFACCKPVRGARRGTICDLQREEFHLVPNGLINILEEFRGASVGEIKLAFSHEYDATIDGYFDFLIENELGFWTDSSFVPLFPDLDLSWDEPEVITNAIVDVDEDSVHDYRVLIQQLDSLGCKALQLRFFSSEAPFQEATSVLELANVSCLVSIELLLPSEAGLTEKDYDALCRRFPRVSRIFVHSSEANRGLRIDAGRVPLIFRAERLESDGCCGQVHPNYFVTCTKAFSESSGYNSCLNRKIAIDSKGEVKNCPSMTRSFGRLGSVSFEEISKRDDFRDLWEVNKDQIEICRDCEFRYICTDCRAHLSKPEDPLSKPAKCRYDPYSASWF